jgi:hypothetical protein
MKFRWQDVTRLVAGAFMLFVPLFTADSADNATIWAAEVIGGVIVLLALGAMFYPAIETFEILGVLAGVALFVAPWVLDYRDLQGAATSAWIVGALVAALALFGDVKAHQLHTSRAGGGALQH